MMEIVLTIYYYQTSLVSMFFVFVAVVPIPSTAADEIKLVTIIINSG
jgi:hypothetical protein